MLENQVANVSHQKSIVSLAVDLDKDDVAAILMARAETTIKNAINACAAQYSKLLGVATELNKEIQEQLHAAANAAADKSLKLVTEAAEALGCKQIQHSVDVQGTNAKKGMLEYRLQLHAVKPTFTCDVCAETKATAEVKATWKRIEDNNKQTKENGQVWLDWRRKLQDLPTLERRAKAAVAEQRLSRTAEGQELIALLDSQVNDGIKMLGIS